MSFGNKIFKVISYIFLLFIVAIIVIQFGMPDFIGSAADSNRFKMADVGKETISRRDVARASQNVIDRQMKGEQVPPELEQQIRNYTLEQLIEEKLFLVFSQNVGIYPRGNATTQITKDYLHKNFPTYATLTGFDFDKFEKELLTPNRVTLQELKKDAENFYAVTSTNNLLYELSNVSSSQLQDWAALKEISYSLSLIFFEHADLRTMVSKQVTDAEVQEYFAEYYLKDNPNEKLLDVKEAIVKTLVDQRLPKFQEDWQKQLQQDSQAMTLNELSQKYQKKIFDLPNISAETGISVLEDVPANISLLEKDENFISLVFGNDIDKVWSPIVIDGSVFLVVTKDKKIPDFSKEFAMDKDLEKEIREKDFMTTSNALRKMLSNNIRVKRY